jgi:hypothetical protein
VCSPCLHDYIITLVNKKEAVGIKCPVKVVPPCEKEVSTGHIQEVLSADEFNQYLEGKHLSLVHACRRMHVCECVREGARESNALPRLC